MSDLQALHQAFRRGTAPIFSLLTAEQTRQSADLQGEPSIVERLAELAEKANEGELSSIEEAEYEAYIEANNLWAVLQTEARFRLMRPRACVKKWGTLCAPKAIGRDGCTTLDTIALPRASEKGTRLMGTSQP